MLSAKINLVDLTRRNTELCRDLSLIGAGRDRSDFGDLLGGQLSGVPSFRAMRRDAMALNHHFEINTVGHPLKIASRVMRANAILVSNFERSPRTWALQKSDSNEAVYEAGNNLPIFCQTDAHIAPSIWRWVQKFWYIVQRIWLVRSWLSPRSNLSDIADLVTDKPFNGSPHKAIVQDWK